MPDLQPVEGKVKISADTKGVDDAKTALGGFGGAMQRIGEIAAGVGLERVAEQIIEMGKAAAEFAIDTSSKFEQWDISFTTMLGSAGKAAKLMNEISDFAVKTPFQLPQLVEGSKQLIAFGVGADDVVKRLGQLGDIASAVGTDRLPLLIHAFGQVEAGQRLTGRELNEFVMSGVPLMQALADHYNKVGAAGAGMGTSIEKGTKMSVSAMQGMNNKIQDTQTHLKELADQHPKTAHAQMMHDDAVAKATRNLGQYQDKLAGANKVVSSFGEAHKMTAMEVKKMVENNEVSAKDVETVLGEMTAKGGRFFDMMNQQSKTFGGIISNIHDQFTRFALAVMGFDMAEGSKTFGTIKKGTLFDQMKEGVQGFLDFLNNNQGAIVAALGAITKTVKFLADVSVLLANFIVQQFTPVWLHLEDVYKRHQKTIDLLARLIGDVLFGALEILLAVLAKVIDISLSVIDVFMNQVDAIMNFVSPAITFMEKNWNDFLVFFEALGTMIMQITTNIANSVVDMINKVIDAINVLISGAVKVANGIPGIKISAPTIDRLKNYSGGNTQASGASTSGAPGLILNQAMAGAGINITNNNTFNTKTDPSTFSKMLGLQVSAVIAR